MPFTDALPSRVRESPDPHPINGAINMPAPAVPANLRKVLFFMPQRCVFHFKLCTFSTMLVHVGPFNTVVSNEELE